MSNLTRRIGVVGIDGAGKSTIIKRLLDLLAQSRQESFVINCPLYHNTPNAPLSHLSRALDSFSQAADKMNSYELKAGSLFMQMTLFGPIERFFIDTFQPDVIISERQPVVDALAYGPFYGQMVQKKLKLSDFEIRLREEIEKNCTGGFDQILKWHFSEQKRLSQNIPFEDVPQSIKGVFSQSFEDMVIDLQKYYRTSLPDEVILLDVLPETAAERVSKRSEQTVELHENSKTLNLLRESYHNVLKNISITYPKVRTHIVDTGSGESIDETLKQVLMMIAGS